MFEDIKRTLDKTEQEIRDLRRDKAQAESFVALIMKQIGEINLNMEEIFSVDFKKVRLIVDENDRSKVKVVYMDNFKETESKGKED